MAWIDGLGHEGKMLEWGDPFYAILPEYPVLCTGMNGSFWGFGGYVPPR